MKANKDVFIMFIKMMGILICGGIIGTFLLVLVFCIPVDRMYDHYQTIGLESIERRDGWHKYLVDYDVSTLDNNTEWLMLKIASTPLPDTGENIFQKAMRGYTLNGEWNHGLTFTQYSWKGIPLSCDSYERYWHGYAVLLKPLLLVFSYTDLVFLNIGLQIIIMYAVLILLRKNSLEYLQIPFIIFWIVSMQIIVALCLDYSVCFYIYMGALLILLLCSQIQRNYIYFFLMIGMITAYMDLLTWPLVTLTIPLIVFIQMMRENEGGVILRTMAATCSWGIGYVGQWALKWIIASVFLSDNVIIDAVKQIMFRSAVSMGDNVEDKKVEWIDAVKRNMQVFNKSGYWLLFFVLILFLFYWLVKTYKEMQIKVILPYLMIAAYPFIWYHFTRNHSYEHWWMTWRILGISIFSICCLAGRLSNEHGEGKICNILKKKEENKIET